MTNSGYINRLRTRQENEDLKRGVVFGLIFGWLFVFLGAFHFYCLTESRGWLYSIYAGIGLLTLTLILPQLVMYVQKLVQTVGGFVGSLLFKVILTGAYFVVVLPVGLMHQRLNGSHPFYSWDEAPPANCEGWVDKSLTAEQRSRKTNGWTGAISQPLRLLQYFFANGQLIFLPCLIVFLVLGLVGAFASSSVMAPLIYTLF